MASVLQSIYEYFISHIYKVQNITNMWRRWGVYEQQELTTQQADNGEHKHIYTLCMRLNGYYGFYLVYIRHPKYIYMNIWTYTNKQTQEGKFCPIGRYAFPCGFCAYTSIFLSRTAQKDRHRFFLCGLTQSNRICKSVWHWGAVERFCTRIRISHIPPEWYIKKTRNERDI